jgi:hypothetical protein
MQKQGAIVIVSTRINPGKENAYHKWYDEHVKIMFNYPGIERVSRNRRTPPLDGGGENIPEYITLYELKEKTYVEDYLNSPQMQKAKKQFDDEWEGLGDVLWSGFYEPVNILKRGPLTENTRYTEIVGSGPKPGKLAEYLHYYVGHFAKMFEYNGIREVSYVRLFKPWAPGEIPPYVTIYDFETKELMDAFYQSPVFVDSMKEWEEIGQLVMDLRWAANYESVINLNR